MLHIVQRFQPNCQSIHDKDQKSYHFGTSFPLGPDRVQSIALCQFYKNNPALLLTL
jgi:hypothetical protein